MNIVLTTKLYRRAEAWQRRPPPKSRNAEICKRRTFMINHIFFHRHKNFFSSYTTTIFLLFLITQLIFVTSRMNSNWVFIGNAKTKTKIVRKLDSNLRGCYHLQPEGTQQWISLHAL